MLFTSGEIGVTGLLSVALLGFGGWIKSIANKCNEAEMRMCKHIKALEITVSEKSSLIDVHGTNLCAGEKKMNEMKAQLDAINTSINGVFLLMKETSGKIDGLGEKIATGTKEVFMLLDPRIKRVEEHVEDLKKDKN